MGGRNPDSDGSDDDRDDLSLEEGGTEMTEAAARASRAHYLNKQAYDKSYTTQNHHRSRDAYRVGSRSSYHRNKGHIGGPGSEHPSMSRSPTPSTYDNNSLDRSNDMSNDDTGTNDDSSSSAAASRTHGDTGHTQGSRRIKTTSSYMEFVCGGTILYYLSNFIIYSFKTF